MKVNLPSKKEAGKLWREVQTLRKHIEEVLKHKDEWVLVHGDKIGGYFKSYSEGLREGYKQFGLQEFLLSEVNKLTGPGLYLHRAFVSPVLAA
jgi:hypothetical protein